MKIYTIVFLGFLLLVMTNLASLAQCVAPSTFSANNTCGNPTAPVTIGASNNVNCPQSVAHRWYTSETGSNYISGTIVSVGTCAVFQTQVQATVTTTYWVSLVINGCESPRSKVTATISNNNTPSLKLSPAVSYNGSEFSGAIVCTSGGIGNVTLKASAGLYENSNVLSSVYEWYDSPSGGNLLHTGSTYNATVEQSATVNGVKTFYVGGTLKNEIGCGFSINPRQAISVKLVDYQDWTNRLTTFTPLQEFTDVNTVKSTTASKAITNIDYYDGLGRPLQHVIKQGSPTLKDIIRPVFYDDFGRESRSYLPFTSASATDGSYRPKVIAESGSYTDIATNFYNNPSDDIADDSKPYSTSIFEASPLNRIRKQGAPGLNWQPTPGVMQYANYNQSFGYAGFLVTPSGGGGSVSLQINNNVLTVTFSAGFSSSKLKKGYIQFIQSNSFIHDIDLGLIAMGNYRASIKGGYIFIESTSTTDAFVTGFGMTNYGANTTFIIDLVGIDRSVKQEYKLNKVNEVLNWDYNEQTKLIEAGAASAPNYFPANKVFVTKIFDEHNKLSIEYKDNEGRILLKRTQIGASATTINDVNFASTYYIYDDFGSLICVLPPEATTRLNSEYFHFEANNTSKESFLKLWAFQYRYDSKRRLIEKSVPGVEPVFMVYDNRNRLVLSQDGNQRALTSKEWTFTKYDRLNRPVSTGKYINNADRETMQISVNNYYSNLTADRAWFETYVAGASGNVLGYNNASFPQVTDNASYYSVIFYDTYDAFNSPSAYVYQKQALTAHPASYFLKVKGLVVAQLLKNLTTGGWMRSVNYYDSKYRLIQNISDHQKGIVRLSNSYDFNGSVIHSSRRYTVDNVDTDITESFTYDHMKRSLVKKHKVNKGQEVVLSANYYNELGQLVNKGIHATDYPPIDNEIGDAGVVHNSVIERSAYNSAEKALVATNSIRLTNGFHAPAGSVFSARIGFTQQEAADAIKPEFNQVVDFRYNIQGWLTRMNNADVSILADGNAKRDYFGMEMTYENAINGISTIPTYNGNLSAIQWSQGYGAAIKKQAYTFQYDNMNRLQQATHYEQATGIWQNNNQAFSESQTFDLNGNIKTLIRKGVNGSNLDNLAYGYTGNKLDYVHDSHDANAGFINGSTGNDDYNYDSNGNLIRDKNKGLMLDGTITYNHLNFVKEVVKGTERIVYMYNASGKKMAQELFAGSTLVKRTDYIGELVLENGAIAFIHHAEGRYVPASDEYQYHLKDHLGNVRLTFTTKESVETTTATLETSQTNSEQGNFLKYNDIRKVNSPLFDHTNTGSTQYAMRLSGSPQETYGLAYSLAVMPGDVISAEVFAKYVDLSQPDVSTALENFIGAIVGGAAASGTVIDGGSYGSPAAATMSYGTLLNKTQEGVGAPKAYLNWIVFDKNFVPIASKSGFDRISTAARETGSLAPEGIAHERLFTPAIEITEPGYIYIYLSNEQAGTEVYFDDFRVTNGTSPIISMSDYYPFGYAFNAHSRENSLEQKHTFNGIEEQTDLGLNWLQTPFRSYDATSGRFLQVDPLAHMLSGISQYHFGFNNPTRYVDPLGLMGQETVGADGFTISEWMAQSRPGGPTVFDVVFRKDRNPEDKRSNNPTITVDGEEITDEDDEVFRIQTGNEIHVYYAGYFSGEGENDRSGDNSDTKKKNLWFTSLEKATGVFALATTIAENGARPMYTGPKTWAAMVKGSGSTAAKMSRRLGFVGIGFTVADGLANGWENHHNADVAIGTALIIGSFIPGVNVVLGIGAAAYFIADTVVLFGTKKSITEHVFD